MNVQDLKNLPINTAPPKVMHIDLNSCFATIMQQSHKSLRGKPVLIAAYNSPRGCVVAPSIEAKALGVKTGMRVYEALGLAPHAIVRTPDTCMIRDVHMRFKKICQDYSPEVFPKSIDELVIDFRSMDYLLKEKSMFKIGQEIKQRILKEVGEWMRCSIGISTNRFLAKVAASYKKPDGLISIDHRNIHSIYNTLKLTDLPYIKERNQARLKSYGIFTIREFINAPMSVLQYGAFKSIIGIHWYKRIRGWEVDDVEYDRKSFGQDYSFKIATNDKRELSTIIMKLCEKMGRRLRRHNKVAYGIHVAVMYINGSYWHMGRKTDTSMYATIELYKRVWVILTQSDIKEKIAKISVSCYDLHDYEVNQLSLFETCDTKLREVSKALDKINDRYGEFVITPATMMSMDDRVIDRISFGAVKEIQDLYQ
ncbi:DNA polymerase IV [soil metagenome]